jgi:hypothetical protein
MGLLGFTRPCSKPDNPCPARVRIGLARNVPGTRGHCRPRGTRTLVLMATALDTPTYVTVKQIAQMLGLARSQLAAVRNLLTLCLECEGLTRVSRRLGVLPTIEDWPTAVTAAELISELVPPGNQRLDAITPSVVDALTNIRVGDVANWRVRSDAADWLAAAGLARDASLLRGLPPIRTDGAAKLARQALETTIVSLNEVLPFHPTTTLTGTPHRQNLSPAATGADIDG